MTFETKRGLKKRPPAETFNLQAESRNLVQMKVEI